jgi:hypothetical protein
LMIGATGSISNTAAINLAGSTATLDVTAASGFAIVSNQALTGVGSVTGVTTVALGGVLAPGGTDGTMTVRGLAGATNLVLSGALAAVMDASRATTTPWLSVTGSINLASATLVATNLNRAAEHQPYTLLTYTGSRIGAFVTQTLTPGWSVYYDDANQSVQLRGPALGTLIMVQ